MHPTMLNRTQPQKSTDSPKPFLRALNETTQTAMWTLLVLSGILGSQLQCCLELEDLFERAPLYPRFPVPAASQVSSVSGITHCPYTVFAVVTLHEKGTKPLNDVLVPAGGDEDSSCRIAAPQTASKPTTIILRTRRRRCNSGLVPQLEETLVSNPVPEAASWTDNNENSDFNVIRSKRSQQPKEHSSFSVLSPTDSLKGAMSPVRPRLHTQKHKRHKQKGTAFCPRSLHNVPGSVESNRLRRQQTFGRSSMTACHKPLSAYSSNGPTCTSLPQWSPGTEATKVDDGEVSDEDNSLPTLQSSSSSQALTCSSAQSSSRTEVIKVDDGDNFDEENSIPRLNSSSSSQAICGRF